VECDEVEGAPVLGFGLVKVLEQLLQLAIFADLQRW